MGSLIRTAFWIRTFGSGAAVFSTTVWRPFFNLIGALNATTRWWSLYLLGTQPNVYLSVRKFDDASSPGQAAIGTMPLGDNAWHHVEVEFLIGTTSGTVRTWVDGVADISFTGDTSDAASGDFSVMDHVLLCGSCSNSGNTGTYMDDVIIWDDEGDAFTGRLTDRHRIRTVLPDANGSVNDFTPLSGTNVENVDDVIRDKDTILHLRNGSWRRHVPVQHHPLQPHGDLWCLCRGPGAPRGSPGPHRSHQGNAGWSSP